MRGSAARTSARNSDVVDGSRSHATESRARRRSDQPAHRSRTAHRKPPFARMQASAEALRATAPGEPGAPPHVRAESPFPMQAVASSRMPAAAQRRGGEGRAAGFAPLRLSALGGPARSYHVATRGQQFRIGSRVSNRPPRYAGRGSAQGFSRPPVMDATGLFGVAPSVGHDCPTGTQGPRSPRARSHRRMRARRGSTPSGGGRGVGVPRLRHMRGEKRA
jgi:hypothetical protein